MKKPNLYIREYRDEPSRVKYKTINRYYDINSGICIYKMTIEQNLIVGKVYDFKYEKIEDGESNTYCYIVLRKEDSNIYYITEFYPYHGFIIVDEKSLLPQWIKCDVEKELGINLNEWRNKTL